MVLAAGLGTRMRPITDSTPKPLVKISGKPLIDHVLDRLDEAGVERAVVNVHHMADRIRNHLSQRRRPEIVISDERGELLGTGGGVKKALPELGDAPFFHINSDTIWMEGVKPNLARLAANATFDTPAFARAYATLGAQRASKILGIFARLERRDRKPQYLRHLPRVWTYLQRSLAHPALRPLAAWYRANVPPLKV